jgi:oligoendopeptidase F
MGDGISFPFYDKFQYFVINYQNRLSDVFTLTHELGMNIDT